MSRLLLLRHAKASWAQPGMRDFDRPLHATGERDAARVGEAMAERGFVPDSVICSTARRARDTWSAIASVLSVEASQVTLTETLYSVDSAGYLDVIRSSGEKGTLLIVGHNPMIEDVAFAFCGDSGGMLPGGFPTAGLAVLSFPKGLSAAAPAAAVLQAFLSPRDL